MRVFLTLIFIHMAISSEAGPYLPINHPMLREVVEEVNQEECGTVELELTIEKMLSIARDERSGQSMVGLAAPQIGIPKAIILVDMHISESREAQDFKLDPEVFINPRITWYSDDVAEFREGCFSTGNLSAVVARSRSIHIEALSRLGKRITKNLDGYTARIFQHEVDHLNGLRFPDRLKDFSKLHKVEPDQREEYREKFETWPCTCSYKEWLSMISSDVNW